VFKKCHQNFSLLNIIILVTHHLFEQKWFTLSVIHPMAMFTHARTMNELEVNKLVENELKLNYE
jgi:hypothetical protein